MGLLAPAIAGAGIAYAYGPGVDPAYELSMSMAVSDRMVLLARVLAIFAIDTRRPGPKDSKGLSQALADVIAHR